MNVMSFYHTCRDYIVNSSALNVCFEWHGISGNEVPVNLIL